MGITDADCIEQYINVGEGKMLTAAIQEECFEVVAHLSRQLQTPTYS